MRQVVQNIKNGVVSVEQVPVPILRRGCVLVKNRSSLISAGTEGGTVKLGKKSLLGKAKARPEQVGKVFKALKTEGVVTTVNAVRRTLEMPIPLGYSCAGTIEAVSDGIDGFSVGDRVACGGAGMAVHADYVIVPKNLCVPIPDDVEFKYAAFATIGSIALQSVRIADVKLGENIVVIGLGLVGVLVANLLKAAGCSVFGIDVAPDRIKWAMDNHICSAALRGAPNLEDHVLQFSGGFGADSIIITAAVESNDPVALAGELARHKGSVVVVGRTKMEAPRETYLFKELKLLSSYAYGPGADDATYELQGVDYPIGYVRWTENRNMQCFLELVTRKELNLDPLITHSFSINDAPQAFELVTSPHDSSIGVLLDYGTSEEEPSVIKSFGPFKHKREYPGALRTGIIGAGSFATNIMVPLLQKRNDIRIEAIASANGLRAAALAKQYGIPTCSSDPFEIINSKDIDCIFIFTRHGTHAELTAEALNQGKHVFVEKPLAMNLAELESVEKALDANDRVLMVGFNRRFSPLFNRLKNFFADSTQPMVINYRGNVGYRPPDHWLHDPVDGGGVLVGEACHYIDSCCWLADSFVKEIDAFCVGESNTRLIPEDNLMVSLKFDNGSIANIAYVSNGSKTLGTERCEIHCDSKSAVWKDFKYVRLARGMALSSSRRHYLFTDKGYKNEIDIFIKGIRIGMGLQPIWINSQIDASRATILAAGKIFK